MPISTWDQLTATKATIETTSTSIAQTQISNNDNDETDKGTGKGTTTTDQNKVVVVYGHIDIPKTNGSSINQQLVNQYERVCTNRDGYSFDAASGGGATSRGNIQDMQSKVGFEDCDYISLKTSDKEENYTIWQNIIDTMISSQQ